MAFQFEGQFVQMRQLFQLPISSATRRTPPLLEQSLLSGNPAAMVSGHADGLRPDIVAGLTTGAVIIPKAMAYAMMAGLPVQVGLYTALVPMMIYAVLGTDRTQD